MGASEHYDAGYFAWQRPIGQFGGWANRTKFARHVAPGDAVLDFGCGGGYLLRSLDCAARLGVEVNPAAREEARRNGIEVFPAAAEVPDGVADVVISNHALEHVQNPLGELLELRRALKPRGRIVLVVPCETIHGRYVAGDMNNHLYSWNPMTLGNLFTQAGFSVIECKPYLHKWPPHYRTIARIGGRPLFELACRLYARLERSSFQVKILAEK